MSIFSTHGTEVASISLDSFVGFESCFGGPVWHSCGVQRWSLGGGGLACCCIAWRGEVGSGAEWWSSQIILLGSSVFDLLFPVESIMAGGGLH